MLNMFQKHKREKVLISLRATKQQFDINHASPMVGMMDW